MKILQNIKPELVFDCFEQISQIPRGSGNEKAISDFLVSYGKGLGLETIQDEALNVIIKKKGSAGYENAPTVIIQGHMDMVCEKNADTEHDFLKDPLKLRIDGDNLYATGTTLGADNGIAVAYGMALLADNTIAHPPLEVLITADEEAGMSGAMALKPEHINGKLLINLDTEEEGSLLVSCAGGLRSESSLKINYDSLNSEENVLKIMIKGLKGGHSGMDIHKERGNANKLLGRLLCVLKDKVDFKLVNIYGGSKNNAIPREAVAEIITSDLSGAKSLIKEYENIFKNELKFSDPGLVIELSEEKKTISKVFSEDSKKKSIMLIYLYPNGVNSMSTNIQGLTESSTNLGIISIENDCLLLDSAIRSSINSLKEEITNRAKELTLLVGGEFKTTAPYPAWEYKEDSKLRELCKDVYKKVTGKEAEVYAIHAGVECGLFNENLGDLDMISFGPNMWDVHTPDEHVSISSVERTWNFLLEILKEIK